ncbi:hypothetical protein ACQ4M3_07830 [Leptolyngbya sp. AN03gr2]|uniref:hypothetical protein n=1 Tax=unclassified Leptolyngbya TaxID=2650499 RepID=UPI003D32055A
MRYAIAKYSVFLASDEIPDYLLNRKITELSSERDIRKAIRKAAAEENATIAKTIECCEYDVKDSTEPWWEFAFHEYCCIELDDSVPNQVTADEVFENILVTELAPHLSFADAADESDTRIQNSGRGKIVGRLIATQEWDAEEEQHWTSYELVPVTQSA